MKDRIRSAAVLLSVLTAAVVLDRLCGVKWFSAGLIVAVLCMGTIECFMLLRLSGQLRFPEAAPRLTDAVRRLIVSVVCIGAPGAFLVALRFHERGLLLALYVVIVAKMVDNGALLAGRLWGRHKLAPAISPNKTIEGVIGGLFSGILTAAILGPMCAGRSLSFFMIFGAAISLCSVLGDLAESLLKRRAGVKDSGSILPGIGGILDLLDSILLSAPVGYSLLVL
jgi:CDP-diglyceride synthetase